MPTMLASTVNSDIGSYQVALLPDDHISDHIRRSGQPYEATLVAIVRELTRPGSTILDVGANLGNHTIYWAKAGRRVIAFEPNPETRSALAESVRLNGLEERVDICPVALGSAREAGTLRAFLEHNKGAIAVEPATAGEVQIIRLDDLNVSKFSVMKIDVEGAEGSVITGARETIRRIRPIIIAEARGDKGDVVILLRDLGYRRVPVSLAFTPTYLYIPSPKSIPDLLRSRVLIRKLAGAAARRLHLLRR